MLMPLHVVLLMFWLFRFLPLSRNSVMSVLRLVARGH